MPGVAAVGEQDDARDVLSPIAIANGGERALEVALAAVRRAAAPSAAGSRRSPTLYTSGVNVFESAGSREPFSSDSARASRA